MTKAGTLAAVTWVVTIVAVVHFSVLQAAWQPTSPAAIVPTNELGPIGGRIFPEHITLRDQVRWGTR